MNNPKTAAGYETFTLSELTRAERYMMLTGAVTPRPIALITSLSAEGHVNAAPFSQFMIAAVDPGLLAVSIGPGPRGAKDTLVNIQANGEFVINMVPDHLAETVQQCGEDHPADVSEVDLLGLDLLPAQLLKPPRLAMADIQFECRLNQIVELGDVPNRVVIGEVARMHVREGFTADYKIDPRRHRPLARIGGRNYVRFGEIVSV